MIRRDEPSPKQHFPSEKETEATTKACLSSSLMGTTYVHIICMHVCLVHSGYKVHFVETLWAECKPLTNCSRPMAYTFLICFNCFDSYKWTYFQESELNCKLVEWSSFETTSLCSFRLIIWPFLTICFRLWHFVHFVLVIRFWPLISLYHFVFVLLWLFRFGLSS